MLAWDISEAEVQAALNDGETIEQYVDGGRLVLGRADLRVLHVVVADRAPATIVVVTVYPPDPGQWDAAFRARIGP
jgi:hypothetical protein